MSKQKGFSIIELLISLFIVGVMFLVYNAAANTVYLNANAQNQELALKIAANEMETLRSGGYNLVPSSGPFSHTLLNLLPAGSASLVTSDYNTNTKQVTATVSWQDRYTQANRSVTLTTLITKGGL